MSRHMQAENPTVYMQIAKGYTTVLLQDRVVCCLMFYLPRTARMHTLRHASGVI